VVQLSWFGAWSVCLGVAVGLAMSVSRAADPSQGPRIVFFGDSITEAGAGPHGYVTLARQALAAASPDTPPEVIGAGISGNRVPDLLARLDRDVLARKPDVVVIYIGINDVWHSQNGRGTPKGEFEKGLRTLVEKIRAVGGKPVLCTPTVIGEKKAGTNPLDGMLDEYAEITRGVSAETKAPLIDLRAACIAHLAEHNKADAKEGVLTTDGVHLTPAGDQFIAAMMVDGLQKAGVVPASDDRLHSRKENAKVLRHVVLFKFKETSTEADVETIVKAFAALPGRINEIQDFEWGTDNSPEGLQQGLTHCFFVTFASEADRDAYLPHPAHKEFVDLVGPHVEKVTVVDYWTRP
jgi:lysophospholipase L1-like esterase